MRPEPKSSPRQQHERHRAQRLYTEFLAGAGLTDSRDALLLHLTDVCLDGGTSGRTLRNHLQALDSVRAQHGQPPWTADAHVRRFLAGMHATHPLRGSPRSEPLYREHVRVLVDTIKAPTLSQERDVAVIILGSGTGLPATILADLRWSDLTITRTCVTVDVPPRKVGRGSVPASQVTLPATNSLLNPVHAVRRLHLLQPPGTVHVLAAESGVPNVAKIGPILTELREAPVGARERDAFLAKLVSEKRRATIQQARDATIVTIAFAAALRGRELINLQGTQVQRREGHLVLDIPGRLAPTTVMGTGGSDCPIHAFNAWEDATGATGQQRFFTQISGSRLWNKSLTREGLNQLLQQRCGAAQLRGDFTFTSLRTGWIRGALRDGMPAYKVAQHADLRALSSIGRHERRETLISQNVADRLGL